MHKPQNKHFVFNALYFYGHNIEIFKQFPTLSIRHYPINQAYPCSISLQLRVFAAKQEFTV